MDLVTLRVLGFSVLLALAGADAQARAPVPVSPGGSEGVVVVVGRCPTFHWTTAHGAESIDLIVYRVRDEQALGPPQRALLLTLPGSAQGWTPSLDQCLEAGGRYAWSVRGAGEWSEASLFEISLEPSADEVERAIAVLERLGEHPRPPKELRRPFETTESRQDARREPLAGASTPQPDPASDPDLAAEPPRSAAPTPSANPALVVDGQVHLGPAGDIYRDDTLFLWTDGTISTSAGTLALGLHALEASTGISNTAVGHTALQQNSTGERNSAFGEDALLSNTTGSSNSAFGEDALRQNTTGYKNSAFGQDALRSNVSGRLNSAFGENALRNNTFGNQNNAFGKEALRTNSSGSRNNAVGYNALFSNYWGDYNIAVGTFALRYSTGNRNTAIGDGALSSLETGDGNIAIGKGAGNNLEGDGSSNIFIGNTGHSDDEDTIRVGHGGHDRAFLAGVRGITTDVADAVTVLIDSAGQLGTISSSRSVKQDIRNVGPLSRRLLDLRPVAFRYRKHAQADPDTPTEFGLIAEEVAEVFPELVVHGGDGRAETVRYHLLSSLLLNELQEQHRRVQVLSWLVVTMMLAGIVLALGRWRFG